ncbi:MAG: aromatic amino acid aminotransferase [Polyangiaceae bacterium]|jgi:aromatic-amino-acid transaminase|nr:aromatic amino acid aminotransferase [Polyangiaceae bacterium]
MTQSPFADVSLAPADPILGLTEAFLADKNPKKVNLGVGVYQDGNGKVPVLSVVREAEKLWYEKEDSKSYIPIDGVPAYRKEVQELLLGKDSELIAAGRVVTAQALGGTGALKLGADFLRRWLPGADLYISAPSWENHRAVFETAGFTVKEYAYYSAESHGLSFEAMKQALVAMPAKSVVLLHACCHNPTGVDLSPAQWEEVVDIVRERDLVPFIDFAYQGFGEGIVEDAVAVRAFTKAGLPCVISSSFSKSFSLYRERVGAITFITADADEAKRVTSQLKRTIRTNYSSPSSHGGQIVALVLGNQELYAKWAAELTEMRVRIQKMRTLFVQRLKARGITRDFSFIEQQRGMFSYSGLELPQVLRLRSEFGIYIVDSGRICVAAMNETNLDYITDAIAQVL